MSRICASCVAGSHVREQREDVGSSDAYPFAQHTLHARYGARRIRCDSAQTLGRHGGIAGAIIEAFVGLLEAREMTFQDEASLERAVHRYREFNIDFADCLHVATAETFDQLPLASFEKKASDIDGFEALRG